MSDWKVVRIFIEILLLSRACGTSEMMPTASDVSEFVRIDPETADTFDWRNHPCRRNCTDGAPPLECRYIFKLEAYRTMSKACYDCPFNITDCFRMHCVPADGTGRSILTVNRQMPGPRIEVCRGDRVIVDVINLLHSESTAMHWHGQHHVATPYMDGVPYVSQCPISPGSSFRYDYFATEAGTHFWHSHLGFQRGDGVFGSLIVRTPPKINWHRDLYDIDEHVILILDWTRELGIDKFLDHHYAGGDNKPPNILINGLGRFTTAPTENNVSAAMPVATFLVKQNTRYRFRLINAEFLNCPVELSIDNHTMNIISSDGRDVEPVQAKTLVSYAGERFDFVLEANQKIDNYWIRVRGLMDCDERFTKAFQVGILRYDGAIEQDPKGRVTYERELDDLSDEKRVNGLNEGTERNSSLSVPLLRAMDENDESNTLEPDYQFYVSYDFYKKDNPHFHRSNLYGFEQVNITKRVLTPQLNHISMKLPSVPLLSQRDIVDQNRFCNESTVQGCEQTYCACTHVLRVKLGSVVEVVLVDEGFAYDANHPFHLHGYQFRVVAMERVGRNVTVETVRELDRKGLIRRNLDRAPLKDTVTVPDGGYTVIRFHANNPGYWLFHCHIEFHAEVGMSLVFKVGEDEDMPPVPRNFPHCGNWRSKNDPHGEFADTVLAVSAVKDPSEEVSNTVTSDNGTPQFVHLLARVLKTLRISSSTQNPTVSFFLLSFCLLVTLPFREPGQYCTYL
nr:laccase-1-like isoform X2 [Nomia melanderi]XP_031845395.1 laccase-1-like isoform X2 [Nomia melanderi]XP_031845396.1 laccase-1-like isoform X2 [Nomia melanderi]XP_031845397.1 laccase-1-like isoform X2 [Nomia melanderi]XP_031845399.1 laccase-1-like isoform X2 [Nomia melanderi]XP_031845400.1 laccase-1-like isoform X2 [Nomia melanderi]